MGDDEDRATVRRGVSGPADGGRQTVIRPVGRRGGAEDAPDEETDDQSQTSRDDRRTILRHAPARSASPDGDRKTVLRGATPGSERSESPPVGIAAPRISLPVFRPGRRSRTVATVIMVIAAAAVGAAAYALLKDGGDDASRPSPTAAALTALSAAVTLDPAAAVLHCPEGRARYNASVTTDGDAGTITYRWTRPDGTQGSVSTASLVGGQRSVSVALDFTFTGSGQAGGVAVFEVLGPNQLSASAPEVAYTCP